jgi:hypothetical protein
VAYSFDRKNTSLCPAHTWHCVSRGFQITVSFDDDHVNGGETTSLNYSHQRAYCSSPMWYTSMEKHVRMILAGENSWFIHDSSLAILPAESCSSKAGGTGWRKLWIWPFEVYLLILWGIISTLWNLTRWVDRFTSHLKEGMLWIFITLKYLLPSARIETTILGSNGKHASHYITKNDLLNHLYYSICNLPWAPNMVALTVDKILSCVPMVGIRSHTCSRFYNEQNFTTINNLYFNNIKYKRFHSHITSFVEKSCFHLKDLLNILK